MCIWLCVSVRAGRAGAGGCGGGGGGAGGGRRGRQQQMPECFKLGWSVIEVFDDICSAETSLGMVTLRLDLV